MSTEQLWLSRYFSMKEKHKVDLILQNTNQSSFVGKAKMTPDLESGKPHNTFDKGSLPLSAAKTPASILTVPRGSLKKPANPWLFGEHNPQLLTAPCLLTTDHTH